MGTVEVVTYAGSAAVIAVIAVLTARRAKAIDRAWRQASAQLDARFTRERRLRCLAGWRDGISFRVEEVRPYSTDRERISTRATVRGHIDGRVSMAAEGVLAAVKKAFGGQDLLVGDSEFDRRVVLGGPEPYLLAALDARARRIIANAVEAHIAVDGGEVRCEQPRMIDRAATLTSWVDQLVEVARCLSLSPDHVASALERNAQHDPLPAVRRHNFTLLVQAYAHSEPAKRAIERALADPDPHLRLEAAGRVDPERGYAVLRALVEESALPTEPRAEALTSIVAQRRYEELGPLLDRVLESAPVGLARVAVEAVGSHRDARRLEGVCRLARRSSSELRVAVATAAGQIGDPRGEATLLELLRASEPEVQLAAAKALGRAGTVRAVEPLLPLTHGVLTRGALKEAAREAIRRIQGRLGPAGAGRLSLAEPGAGEGALQLAAESGAVSVTEPASEPASGEPPRDD